MKATQKSLLLLLLLAAPFLTTYAVSNIVGITEININKIPVGIIDLHLTDDDNDGLDNDLEKSLGTSHKSSDSDNDGYNDKIELENNYSPLGLGKINIDVGTAKKLGNKYLLRVERRGELWLINPKDHKRYLANSEYRKKLLLAALSKTPSATAPPITEDNLLNLLANKIRANDKSAVTSLVANNYKTRVANAMDSLNAEQKLTWANILSSTKLTDQTDTEKIYKTEVFFGLGGRNVTVEYRITKQADGAWLISKI